MKFKAIAVAFICCAANSSFAADRVTLQLSPNDLARLANGLAALDGSVRIVKNQRGEDEAKTIPFDMPDARLTIAHDDAMVAAAIKEFQTAAKGLSADAANALADKTLPIDLLTLDVGALKIQTNLIAPSALAALAPICPSCVGADPAKP